MLENLSADQAFGLILIFAGIAAFFLTIVTLKTKRWQIASGFAAWQRQKRGLDLIIKEDEQPKLFMRGVYLEIISGFIFLILGILLYLEIIKL